MSRSEQENCASNDRTSNIQPTQSTRIRRLNDQFRRAFSGGKILITCGVQALDPNLVQEILLAVRQFDQFDAANDPYNVHDFGSLSLGQQRLCWRIDCYDQSIEFGSRDPSDEAQTVRVLTVMLTSEY